LPFGSVIKIEVRGFNSENKICVRAPCDLVITGEGRLDGQTLDGKGPAGIAQLARAAGKPIIALAGSVGAEAETSGMFDAALPIVDRPATLEESMAAASENLERAATRAARLIRLGSGQLVSSL